MRRLIIGIMGPGEQASADLCAIAYDLGYHIATAGWVVLTGGRNTGVMDAACRGAKAANGLTLGILPGMDDTHLSPAVDLPIFTGMGHARNAINVLSSDVVVACGMGCGTASEVALALKNGKPVILVRSDSVSEAFFKQLAPGQVQVVTMPDEVVERIRAMDWHK
ncbi:TIGR00725 family protein [Vacuolonema iberomarrocanum]|uniref:TIGR00725 family protein n=1 Tax=Vacuolonema iberomarrocanum TaxID=3454632 RepID=UPI001A08619B|nr:TIGR00725 family protein [filamentous cyanobacterium LEGE 07170]